MTAETTRTSPGPGAGRPDRPRVLVAGYYGYGNIGDEAILRTLLLDLHAQRPELGYIVLSGSGAVASPAPPGIELTLASRLDPRAMLAAMRRTRMLILGGGGLIQDVTSLRSLLYYLGLIWAARRLKLPVTIYGGGIGPVGSTAGRRLARMILPQIDLLALRDQQSMATARSLGVPAANLVLTADPAFNLPQVDPLTTGGSAREALQRSGVPGNRLDSLLGWALKPPMSAADEAEAAIAVRLSAERTGLFPVLIPFHPEQDQALLTRVGGASGIEHAVLSGVRDPLLLLEVVSTLRLAVAMRLHGVIFAVTAGVPCVALSYDPKVDALAQDVPQIRYVPYPGIDALVLATAVDEVLAQASSLRAGMLRAGAGLRERAQANAALIAARIP